MAPHRSVRQFADRLTTAHDVAPCTLCWCATTGDVTIRRAEPSDSDTVLTMMREIAVAEAVGTVDVSAERWRDLLPRDDVIVFITGHDDSAIGHVSAIRQLNI